MEPPPPRQRRQWVFGNEKVTLAELAGAGVNTPEREPWGLHHSLLGAHEHRPAKSAGYSKPEGLFSERRTSSDALSDGKRRVSNEGFREREQGFNLQLSGANEERVRAQLRRQAPRRNSASEEEKRRRRNWQRAQQLVIRTDDGASLPVEELRGGRKSRGEKGGEPNKEAEPEESGLVEDETLTRILEASKHEESTLASSIQGAFADREGGFKTEERAPSNLASHEEAFQVTQAESHSPGDLAVNSEVTVLRKSTLLVKTAGAEAAYEGEDFEDYEESFEEDVSTEDADVSISSQGPSREAGLDCGLTAEASDVHVPPLEAVESPDVISHVGRFSNSFVDATRASSCSVTYCSIQDLESAQHSGALEVVDVSNEGLEETIAEVARLPRGSTQEVESEEIVAEDVGVAESLTFEAKRSFASEQSRFDLLPKSRASFSGHQQKVRPLSALTSPKPNEPVPRAALTARDRSRPEAEVNLILEAVKRENARALEAQKVRPTELERRKSLAASEQTSRRQSLSENAEQVAVEEVGTRGYFEQGDKPIIRELSEKLRQTSRRQSLSEKVEMVAVPEVGTSGSGGYKQQGDKPLMSELSEKLRLLDTQKQQYLLEVVHRLERQERGHVTDLPQNGSPRTESQVKRSPGIATERETLSGSKSKPLGSDLRPSYMPVIGQHVGEEVRSGALTKTEDSCQDKREPKYPEEDSEAEASVLRNRPSPRAGRRLSTGSRSRNEDPFLSAGGETRESRSKEVEAGNEKANRGARTRSHFVNVLSTDTPSPTSSPESVFGVTSAQGRRREQKEVPAVSQQTTTAVKASGQSSTGAVKGRRSLLGKNGFHSPREVGSEALKKGNEVERQEVGNVGAHQKNESKQGRRRSAVKRYDDDLSTASVSLPPSDGTSLHQALQSEECGSAKEPEESPRKREVCARTKGRDRNALEQSLDSLAFFRHSHAGRLHIPLPPPESPNDNAGPGLLAPTRRAAENGSGKADGDYEGRDSLPEKEVRRASTRLTSQDEEESSLDVGRRSAGASAVASGRESKHLYDRSDLKQATIIPSSEGRNEAREIVKESDALASFLGPTPSAVDEALPTFFTIPCEPRGSHLTVLILENWGDPFYVGLSGLEVFDSAGNLLPFRSVKAEPPDLNALSGYGSDPRTVDKLVDGVNWTCDDLHAWLAPFTPGEVVSISLSFEDVKTLGMIRVWNYNCTRIHSFRGVKTIQVTLDDQVIFMGEVRRASGLMEGALQCAECLLFSESENTLRELEQYDKLRYSETANAIRAAAAAPEGVSESLALE